MHYIAGTQILVSGRTISRVRPGMTGSELRASSSGGSRFKKERSMFTPDRTYTLTRIRPVEEGVEYTFSDGTGTRTLLEFPNIREAETFISELRDESVPDYSSIHEHKTD